MRDRSKGWIMALVRSDKSILAGTTVMFDQKIAGEIVRACNKVFQKAFGGKALRVVLLEVHTDQGNPNSYKFTQKGE